MAKSPSAFLVARRDDGFGDVYPLQARARGTRSAARPTNRIVLRDDLCSREHAEVFSAEGGWHVRDLGSLNGTHLNGEPLRTDRPLRPLDEVRVGRTRLVFVDEMAQLPDMPEVRAATGGEGRRPGNPQAARPDALPAAGRPRPTGRRHRAAGARVAPPQAVAVLYRLALDMAAAADRDRTLRRSWWTRLFRATPAEVGGDPGAEGRARTGTARPPQPRRPGRRRTTRSRSSSAARCSPTQAGGPGRERRRRHGV